MIQIILQALFCLPQFLHEALYRLTRLVVVKHIDEDNGIIYYTFQAWNKVFPDIDLTLEKL